MIIGEKMNSLVFRHSFYMGKLKCNHDDFKSEISDILTD